MAKYSFDEKAEKILIIVEMDKNTDFHDAAKTTIKAVKEAIARSNKKRELQIETNPNRAIRYSKDVDYKELVKVFLPEYILPYVSRIYWSIHTLKNEHPRNDIPKSYDTLFEPN